MIEIFQRFFVITLFTLFVYWHKGKKNQCVRIDAQVYVNEAHEKLKNAKIYGIFESKKRQVFVYWHRGKKNQSVGIDAQVYVNEALEKLKNAKIYGIFREFFLLFCVATIT